MPTALLLASAAGNLRLLESPSLDRFQVASMALYDMYLASRLWRVGPPRTVPVPLHLCTLQVPLLLVSKCQMIICKSHWGSQRKQRDGYYLHLQSQYSCSHPHAVLSYWLTPPWEWK